MPLPPPLPISAVLITLNAVHQLEEAIKSVGFCDECLVVDSGSSDGTVALARQLGARVLHCDWRGFGPQKHWAVAQAKHAWVLCLDADERVGPELQHSIQALWQKDKGREGPLEHIWGFKIPRCNAFLGRMLRHGEGYPDWCLRLFNRQYAQWSQDAVHEKVEPLAQALATKTGDKQSDANPIGKLCGNLLHYSADTLEHYLNKQNCYTTLQAQHMAALHQYPSAARMAAAPWVRFFKFYVLRLGFLDGWQGFVHIGIGCFFTFVKYAKARELQAKHHAVKKEL
jgi:glycosyltransferase involved in cell wall biosynthesis